MLSLPQKFNFGAKYKIMNTVQNTSGGSRLSGNFFRTSGRLAPLVSRVLLAVVLFPHGAQKLLGWFNGYGFSGTMDYFTGSVGIPYVVGVLVILIEFFGPLFLLAGLGTRLWSLGIMCVMAGVIVTEFHDYFFMDWFGSQPAEGIEFFLLGIGISLSLFISGGGIYSVDAAIWRRGAKAGRLHGEKRGKKEQKRIPETAAVG